MSSEVLKSQIQLVVQAPIGMHASGVADGIHKAFWISFNIDRFCEKLLCFESCLPVQLEAIAFRIEKVDPNSIAMGHDLV